MIDAFLTTVAQRPIRIAIAATTITWWMQEAARGRVALTIFDCGADPRLWSILDNLGWPRSSLTVVEKPREDSNRRRHKWAAELATTGTLISSDDDLIPARRTCVRMEGFPTLWCDYIRDAMERHPRWGLMSALVTPGGIDPYATSAALRRDGVEITPAEADRIEVALALPVARDGERWPVGNCGGVRVMRKGVIAPDAELPPVDPEAGGGYDGALCGYVRDQGYEIGRLVRWRATHIGAEESEVWRGGGREED